MALAAFKHGGHMKHRAGGGPTEALDTELKEDEKEGRGSEKYDAVGSKTEKEAEADDYGGHKHGGKIHKRKHGGKVHHGGAPMHVDGKAPRHHRMDRMARKSGGGIGADMHPMTAAAKLSAPKGASYQTTTDKRDD